MIGVIFKMLDEAFINKERHHVNHFVFRERQRCHKLLKCSRLYLCHIQDSFLHVLGGMALSLAKFYTGVAMTATYGGLLSKVFHKIFLTAYFLIKAVSQHRVNTLFHALAQILIYHFWEKQVLRLLTRCRVYNIRCALAWDIMQYMQLREFYQSVIYYRLWQVITI